MVRKFFITILLLAFISCGSPESDSVVESTEPIETTTSTTTTKAQDSTIMFYWCECRTKNSV